MPDPAPRAAPASRPEPDHAARLRALPRRAYRFRVLGMGLAGLPVAAVAHQLGLGWAAWAWIALSCFLWPHIAYAVAIRSRDPLKAELRNFVTDSFFCGTWLPLMHFNLLPSAVLASVVMADKINAGVRGLWLRSLPAMAAGVAAVGIGTGFAVDYPTSTAVILSSLPIMIIHTLAVSLSTHQLVRRVQRQNLQLAERSRRDMLTGLDSRAHWETQATALLARHHDDGLAATLLLMDADDFKGINDRHGHAVGDDVLRGIGARLREVLPADSIAGRLGGDEFVVVLPMRLAEARGIAERVRAAVSALAFARVPGLACSTSIGLAEPPGEGLDLREWIEAADRALYRAKQAGRNRVGAESTT